jgi:NNP family nitrate/nitrite transporter-like MFS transporter
MLVLATVGFLVNFWAWALISPLAAAYRGELDLSPFQQSLLVALPVLVGSLGRIPVGALTDKFGARVMFPIVSFLTILPVLFVGLAGDTYARLLLGGFFLGIGGTAFAVGVPFVNAWFPPERRGLAVGIFGAGMGGTAISALTTVKLVKAHGFGAPFVVTATALAAYGVVAAFVLRDAPDRPLPAEPLGRRVVAAAKLPVTWRAALLYAIGFGGYVAFSVYLPTYLKTAYSLTQTDAANKMAGFVLVAVVMRRLPRERRGRLLGGLGAARHRILAELRAAGATLGQHGPIDHLCRRLVGLLGDRARDRGGKRDLAAAELQREIAL